jgi:hypothetical protein
MLYNFDKYDTRSVIIHGVITGNVDIIINT